MKVGDHVKESGAAAKRNNVSKVSGSYDYGD
jgi:hypothetical protein